MMSALKRLSDLSLYHKLECVDPQSSIQGIQQTQLILFCFRAELLFSSNRYFEPHYACSLLIALLWNADLHFTSISSLKAPALSKQARLESLIQHSPLLFQHCQSKTFTGGKSESVSVIQSHSCEKQNFCEMHYC